MLIRQLQIFNLMAQSDTQASINIAISSSKDNEYMQNIADATLRDSSSMKTIAILTMVFLPGTFVCVNRKLNPDPSTSRTNPSI